MKLTRPLSLLLLAAATVSAGAAVAADSTPITPSTTTTSAPGPGARHWRHGPHDRGMFVGVMLRAVRKLDLTADQEASIKSILGNARAQRQAAAGSASIDVMTLANPGDPNYGAALQNAKAAAATRLQNEVELQSEIYNVLTGDQKARLPQVLAQMKSKFEARRAAWQRRGSPALPAGGSN